MGHLQELVHEWWPQCVLDLPHQEQPKLHGLREHDTRHLVPASTELEPPRKAPAHHEEPLEQYEDQASEEP